MLLGNNDNECLFFDSDGFEKSANIIDALDRVQEEAQKSKLSEEFWEECSADITYLCERLELNKHQVILLAIMAEIGDGISWRRLGEFIGISRLKAMAFTPDIEDLRKKRWIYRCAVRERNVMFEGFKLVKGVINALRHNEKFVPEKIEGLSEQVFIDRLTRYICNEASDNSIPYEENNQFMMELVEANPELPICKEVEGLDEESSKIILLLEVADYARYFDTPNEGLTINEIHSWFSDTNNFDMLAKELIDGSHVLFVNDILEHGCENGMIDTERYKLTAKAKENLLSEFQPHKQKKRITANKELIKPAEIKQKNLFYQKEDSIKISRLKSLLRHEELKKVQQRLEDSGLRRGIACLFYGAPGTGKTETVLQLARETGREIMRIDIAGLRDKFVGESEKNIKSIFKRYRFICSHSEKLPILFFNEADAIINNRFEMTRSSVEKMDNAIQNIILQELEDLDGIFIATTNLTGVLDKAFDRRFLFKIEFSKPDLAVKKEIWRSFLPEISEEDCVELAREFDFSGGQIENIVRKIKIDYVITGNVPTLSQIQEFCREEYLNRSNRIKIGF